MRVHNNVGVYHHRSLNCRIIRPLTRGTRDHSGVIGYPWVGLFSLCRELRREGYEIEYCYRVWSNNWLVCVRDERGSRWETC